ncbi:5'-AMP-activated protein kinase beta subunit, interation domain-containing protein [Geopyxis carbonaria]|nr:5'-AMP-activated protein kinase beta subunit, interation domain-containing protein [Geopyxis carbonaria]
MGNNPSRSAAHAHQQSTSSSASASPPNAPSRISSSSSSRRPGYRRNSLQPPASAKYSSPTSQDQAFASRPRQDVLSDYRYAAPPRRESIAEGIPESYTSNIRSRDEVLKDAATLRQFPVPPSPKQTTPTFSDISYTTNEGTAFQKSTVRPPYITDGIRHARGSVESTVSMNEPDLPETDVRAIPTVVQWPYDGNKVYLTGTFCGWAKKYRLTQESNDSVLSAVVPIPPGTHHVKFLVDGEMRTSQAIPTAVDDTGILVNYLEVSADDMPPLNRQTSIDCQDEMKDQQTSTRIASSPILGSKCYTQQIPAYLRDFVEGSADDSEETKGVASYTEDGPPPPSLPMMLQKVILNANSQMKDDASVLTIPNHAVLNHLATSSIKNHILAVSATTRYRKKYVTTLLYKAASGS